MIQVKMVAVLLLLVACGPKLDVAAGADGGLGLPEDAAEPSACNDVAMAAAPYGCASCHEEASSNDGWHSELNGRAWGHEALGMLWVHPGHPCEGNRDELKALLRGCFCDASEPNCPFAPPAPRGTH